jgi:hypothetical protein
VELDLGLKIESLSKMKAETITCLRWVKGDTALDRT